MKVIVAVDKEWGIGKNNGMLFHMPKDLQFFKEKTLGKVVVMGGNTLLSFPGSKPLPKRKNIVLSDVFTRDDCEVFATLDELIQELKKYPTDDLFIIGGAMFYRTMIDYCDTAYITKVDAVGGATVFFPNLDEKDNWTMVDAGSPIEDNGVQISFTTYVNNSVKEL